MSKTAKQAKPWSAARPAPLGAADYSRQCYGTIAPNGILRIWKIPVKGFAAFVSLGFSIFVSQTTNGGQALML